MPKALMRAVVLAAFCLAALACAAPTGRLAPAEIRTGVAETATQYVETDVSPDEVAAAVQALIAAAPVCTNWPTLWLDPEFRRTIFRVRYDLMARDWGADVATDSQARMEEFVASGFLTRRQRSEIGPGVVEYELTTVGDQFISGSPYGGTRPKFCAPAERRLVSVTSMEWGRFACGNLQVRFSHVSDDWPSWARAQATRDRLAQTWPAIGAPAEGAVTLSRLWRSDGEEGVGQGELASVCHDANRRRIIGDDLELFSAAP